MGRVVSFLSRDTGHESSLTPAWVDRNGVETGDARVREVVTFGAKGGDSLPVKVQYFEGSSKSLLRYRREYFRGTCDNYVRDIL